MCIFLIPVFVGIITQAVKFVVFSIKHGWNPKYALTHGHMPSAHTAFIVSLVASVGYFEGMNTGAFAVSLILAIIVIDDALRLRMYMGSHSKYLNILTERFTHTTNNPNEFPRLKERIGHKPAEVAVGAVFGLMLTFVLIILCS